MAVQFAVSVMNLAWIAALSVFVWMEGPFGRSLG
jgi:predicted metal-binding membrane protein